nr:DUF2232 domain-containing protein [Paenibacillus sp. GSMTC-2017]
MKTGLKPVLWSAGAFLLLLLLAVPVLNLFALLLMMVPYVVLYSTLSRRSFLLHLLPVWILAGVLIGPAVLIIGLFFVVPSIIMGHLYRKGVTAAKVIKMVCVVILAQLMLELLLFELVLDLSLLDAMGDSIRTTFNEMMAQNMLVKEWDSTYTETLIDTVINLIPVTFIILSFFYTVISHYIARRAVIYSALEVPAFAEAKDWRLPRILVICYLIAYILEMFMTRNSDSFISLAIMNLVPLLQLVFAIQAVGFFFFIAHQKKWNKVVPILIAIPVLIIPPLSLIGVLDTAFPIRKSFTKQ